MNPPLDYTFFERISERDIPIPPELRSYAEDLPGPNPFRPAPGDPALRMEEFLKDLFNDFQQAAPGSSVATAYTQLVDLYTRVLRETTSWLCEDNRHGGPIGRLIALACDRADTINVLTFNHDLVIENEIVKRSRTQERWCLERGYGTFGRKLNFLPGPDPFPRHSSRCNHGAGINVLKLHGSLNWFVRIAGRQPTARLLSRHSHSAPDTRNKAAIRSAEVALHASTKSRSGGAAQLVYMAGRNPTCLRQGSNDSCLRPERVDGRPQCFGDSARRFQGLYPVPTYVGEFLLGRYCATIDEAEIQEGLEIVERLMRERTVRAGEEELFKSNAREHGSIRIIDLITGRLDAATDSYLAELPSLRLNDVSIAPDLVRQNERMLTGGFYAELELAYVANPGGGRPFGVVSIRPIQLSTRHALEDLARGRKRLSTEQWKALLLRSIGLEWSQLTERERDVWLLRMVPFVQRNYNMVEIGPRGTGKSHLFQQVSPYAHLISGGKATVARMFIDNRTKVKGLVCQYDVVCFDEIAGVSFDQKDGVNIMKGYMESGEFSRATGSVKAEGSIVFNGNFEVDVETQLRQSHLFGPLPADIRNDTAFMDRIHSYVPGWDAPKLEKRFFTDHFGLVNDFLAECWRQLRDQSRLPSIPGRFRLGDALSGRDTRAVNLTLDGLLKLLYPDPEREIAEEDLEWALRLALESRRRVKEQQRRIGRSEFSNTQFSYVAGEGIESFVETPEQRSIRLDRAVVPAVPAEKDLQKLIADGESETLEFKASIRYDIVTKGANAELIRGPVKTIAAFMNTEGGTLLVGVTDEEREIAGIENDLRTLRHANVDEYERHLRQALIDTIGVEFTPYVRVSFPEVDGMQVCRVDVATSPKPVFVSNKKGPTEFYIRSGPRSDPLDPEATHGYIEMHWG